MSSLNLRKTGRGSGLVVTIVPYWQVTVECERFSQEMEYHSSKTAPPWLGDFHGNSKNLLTVHSQNFHHRVIGIPASSSKFHHGFDFVHGVLRCSWVATSGSTDRGFSQWVNAGFGGYWVKFRFWGLLIEVEGVLAMEIGASAGPTLAMEIGASAPGIEWLGQRW
uniref:Uncharacterized protein n=1 Tax=Fagus sylvatica TaxID=28930 RepID=A0A2N9J3B9_FAGSY